jgi:hypothetical protein
MKPTTIAAVVLCCTAAAFAQPPSKESLRTDAKSVNENYMYTYNPAPRFSSEGVHPGNSTTRSFDAVYEPVYKKVKPPFADLDVARKNYSVNNQSGSVIVHSSGTTLYVPEEAFMDENGKEVEGNVTVSYREFKNPVDFILAGIPMSYESDGNKNMFLSAGMFDLNASVNGTPVYLKENKKIDVEMVSMDKKPDYNLYAFNDVTGEWEERESKNNITVSESASTTYSPAVSSYIRYLTYNNRRRAVDTTTCRNRFKSDNYFYTSKSTEPISFKRNRWRSKNSSYSALIKIKDVRKNQKDGSIMFRLEKVVGSTHAELGIYSRTAWQVDRMSYPEFKKALGNKNGFFDVRIVKNGGTYSIKLKGTNGFIEVNAEPVKMNKKKKVSEYSPRMESYLYKTYCRLLKSREKLFDKQIARDLKKYRKTDSPAKQDLSAWTGAKYVMTADEKEMTLDEWKAYVEAEKKTQRKLSDAMAANSSNIIRSFSVDGMGIWNCDQIYRLQDPVRIAARYNSKEGEKIKAQGTYVIDKKLNGVLQYYTDEITFSPKSDNVFIVIKPNGEIAYTTSEELREVTFRDKQSYAFKLNDVNTSSTTVEELRKLIGM